MPVIDQHAYRAARHGKHVIAMRAYLDGCRFFMARRAMEDAMSLSTGLRKDGVTPKFHHQLSIAKFVCALTPHLMYPEETIAAAFLHDDMEDHDDVVSRVSLENKYGSRVSDSVWVMTKKYRGMVKPYDLYFDEIASDPGGSVVKPIDRSHNIQTMPDVFNDDKQAAYLFELHEHFYPMIKKARRNFPSQYSAYELTKINLRCQEGLLIACKPQLSSTNIPE